MKPNDSSSQPAYTRLAGEIYDALFDNKDYQQEATRIESRIRQLKQTDGRRLLDVACGTGGHLVFLADKFTVTGLDLSPAQLERAQQKLPAVEFHQANMLDFDLEQHYDVVTCLFRSIGYANQLTAMRQAIQNMADHLRPGGLLIIEPFFTPEVYQSGYLEANFVDQTDLKVGNMVACLTDNDQAVGDIYTLVGQPTAIDCFTERHTWGLYSLDEYQQAIREAGLQPTIDHQWLDGPLLLGCKPAARTNRRGRPDRQTAESGLPLTQDPAANHSLTPPTTAYTQMTADIYDALYQNRDYRGEASKIKEIVATHKQTDERRLLDVACGTGNHLIFLTDDFDLTGLDLSREQLAQARQKLPEIEFHQADMLDFKLDQSYDVITCLFSSIAYANRVADLRQAIGNMADHLRPGGVLIVDPFFTPENYPKDQLGATFVNQPDLKISRIWRTDRDRRQAVWNLHHLVGRPGRVNYFVEHHRLGLYSREEYQQALEAAGLRQAVDSSGNQPLLVGCKPTADQAANRVTVGEGAKSIE